MPVEHAIWKIGKKPHKIKEAVLKSEDDLEEMICSDIGILNEEWMLIGRQVQTGYGKFIDLLALDASGTVIVIELKRNKTPRQVVAQAIDYASWIKGLQPENIADIFDSYVNGKESLDDAFEKKFHQKLEDDELNQNHQIVIVGAKLDSSTERIVNYLSDSDIAINVLFFRVFKDGDSTYLSRIWMIDPAETQEKATTIKTSKEPWNNEFYASFGHNPNGRRWEDAVKYGYISGGGGRWYSKTLFQLKNGDRVWVNIPKTGYVGVGVVQAPAVKASEFMIGDTSFLDLKEKFSKLNLEKNKDDDLAEYLVKVSWIKAVKIDQAVSEVGFFGNQNTVAKPTAAKWVHTVDRLKAVWKIT
jgi:hypothetical protein